MFDSIEDMMSLADLQFHASEIVELFKATESNQPNRPVYGSHSFDHYLLENFITHRFAKGLSTYQFAHEKVWIRKEHVTPAVLKVANQFGMKIVGRSDISLINDDVCVFLNVSHSEINDIKVYSGKQEEADAIVKAFGEFNCADKKIKVRWIYSSDGQCVDLAESFNEQVTSDLYPYIQNFDTFSERFIDATSNILLLIGPPGTGKTSFIKNLLADMDTTGYLTYDEQVLSNDYTFAAFMEDRNAGAFIIEDADLFLKSRADGNGMVSRFLNVGDGIIKMPKKKLIFSTNLPNIKDIDSALIRPGRCFEIIHFRNLTRAEAQIVADNRNIVLPGPEDKQEYSLAEIFNNPVEKPKAVSRFGFY